MLVRQWRRRNDGWLRCFIQHLLELDVVDDDRRCDNRRVRYKSSAAYHGERSDRVHVVVDVRLVGGGDNIFERSRGESAKSHAANQLFLAVRLYLIDKQRYADGTATAPGHHHARYFTAQ